MKIQYKGGIQAVTVVLPGRSLTVSHGDVVDVTKDEADRLVVLPGWLPVKPTAKSATTQPESEED